MALAAGGVMFLASMEPRFGDRGTVDFHQGFRDLRVYASMEPRFGDRGTRTLIRFVRPEVTPLQWSRGSVTAERITLDTLPGAWLALQRSRGSVTAERDAVDPPLAELAQASMEPRFGDRGTDGIRAVQLARAVPASMEPRFGDRGTSSSSSPTGVNRRPPLQWSRGSVTAERAMMMAADGRRAISGFNGAAVR